MAARRLLIVMLILLGLSTLAAALVPQRTLNEGTTTGTTTQTTPSTTAQAPSGVPPIVQIKVGPKRFPLVRAQVDEGFTLLVFSRRPRELSIPEFGLVGFGTADTPARFELLPSAAGTFGILFAASGKPAAQLEVVEPAQGGEGPGKGPGRRQGQTGGRGWEAEGGL